MANLEAFQYVDDVIKHKALILEECKPVLKMTFESKYLSNFTKVCLFQIPSGMV